MITKVYEWAMGYPKYVGRSKHGQFGRPFEPGGVFAMHYDPLPILVFSVFCRVLRQWKTSVIVLDFAGRLESVLNHCGAFVCWAWSQCLISSQRPVASTFAFFPVTESLTLPEHHRKVFSPVSPAPLFDGRKRSGTTLTYCYRYRLSNVNLKGLPSPRVILSLRAASPSTQSCLIRSRSLLRAICVSPIEAQNISIGVVKAQRRAFGEFVCQPDQNDRDDRGFEESHGFCRLD